MRGSRGDFEIPWENPIHALLDQAVSEPDDGHPVRGSPPIASAGERRDEKDGEEQHRGGTGASGSMFILARAARRSVPLFAASERIAELRSRSR